jgi:hypothetical protein
MSRNQKPDDGPTMKQQALATAKRLERSLKGAGIRLDELVFVRASLAPGPDGTVDYAESATCPKILP